VMRLAADHGLTVREAHLVRADLYLADEVFLTGTAAESVPVVAVDNRAIGGGAPGPVTRRLADLFHRVLRGEDDRYIDWLFPVAE
jgi:branched-chain amino acid aminotransferase